MNSLVKAVPNVKQYSSYLHDLKKGVKPIMLSGLTDAAKVHMAFSSRFYTDRPICIITYNEMQAKKMIKDLQYFSDRVEFFPKREVLSFDYIAESKDLLYERISVLNSIVRKRAQVIVTTIEAALQKTIVQESLYKNVMHFKVGETYDLEEIKEKLVLLGYERYDIVEAKGQFSIRGGIIDIAMSRRTGVRIELWGDEVDSIRMFNMATQRSKDMLDEVSLYPAYEFILENDIKKVCKKISEKSYNKVVKEKVERDIDTIKSGDWVNKIDKYFDCFYTESATLLDYLGDDYIIFIDEIEKIKTRADNIKKENENIIKDLSERNKIVPNMLEIMNDYNAFIDQIEEKQSIYLENQDNGFIDKQSMHAKRNGYSFSYREVNFFRSSMDVLFKELQERRRKGKTTVILGGSPENCKKLSSALYEKEIQNIYVENLEEDLALGEITISPGALSAGFEAYDLEFLLISAEELFETQKKKKLKSSSAFKEGEVVVFDDLKVGDIVVHKTHGIGEYIGVNTIKADNVIKDYIKIRYKDGDILYIPTNSLDSIRKFVGTGDVKPRLNRLGSKEWEKTKAKVKNNLREVAENLIELYAKREKLKGFAFSKDTTWQTQFEDSFEYTETDDQLRCIAEIKKDLERERPMDRLLCGDVGYGKTEVAIRAAFKVAMDQKQTAYLVPTTVLANQQYQSFKERMKDFPINIELLNRFKTKKEQAEIIRKLKLGEIDILIGTHRLLSKDVEFKDLGMLIIDEEHRFGVKDKEKIKELKNSVDVLTMTATPIPRTLHMSVVGIRDMSVIYEPPQERKPVQTYVLEEDKEVIKEAITRELEREGQVFYLYNNTETIVKKAEEIKKLVPECKIDFAHGKMSGSELEEIMQNFVDGKTNVLVCTTILESGIDIPNANTIIVENADRLGLAQLYQIRGRVGRSNRQAYAYITYRRDKVLSEIADKRLKAIKEFTEFGSGFKIAMRDLEIRGAGSILGEFQHGHMESVGYDMYCRLLDEVVKEMKGIEVVEEVDVQIDLNVSCYVPDEYVENPSQKIEIYQNISLCRNEEDVTNIIDEIIDRYGQMPKEVENLVEVARIKELCRSKYIMKLSQKMDNIVFYFDKEKFNFDVVDKLSKMYRNRIKFSPAKDPYITLKMLPKQDLFKEIKLALSNM